MEQLKSMKEALIDCVQGEVYNLTNANAQELGAAIDMIKDLSEAIYYCTITEAMEEKEGTHSRHYTKPMNYDYNPTDYNMRYYRDMDKGNGKMYYSDHEKRYPYPIEFRDEREGRSPMSRKMYMEAKEMKHGKEAQMRELEKYMTELAEDMTEMIKDASPDEKALLQKKISTLVTKIDQINV
jgi:hypothetical protein